MRAVVIWIILISVETDIKLPAKWRPRAYSDSIDDSGTHILGWLIRIVVTQSSMDILHWYFLVRPHADSAPHAEYDAIHLFIYVKTYK